MEVLYPLPALSSPEPAPGSEVTVLVHHLVPAQARSAFLDALKNLLEASARAPGALGCKVFQEEENGAVRITILQRFASAEAHEAWLQSKTFGDWKRAVEPLKPALERVRTYSGVEALFVAGQSPDAPPRWKMAIVLLIAVLPLSLAMSLWFGQALARVSPLTGALITSPIMVLLMTYVVVPLLTKIFAGWLQPARKAASPA